MSPRTASRQKVRGQARTTALALFGLTRGKMERPEDREAVALVLRLSGDERMQAIARDAMDPVWRAKSLAEIIEMRKCNYHDVSQEYNKIKRAEGLIRAANHLPDMLEQTALDAQSRDEECSKCDGTGKVTKQIDKVVTRIRCGKCRGTGTVHVLGDTERLKLMFDTFGLTGKDRGPLVNLDLRRMDAHEDLTSLSASISPILEGEVVLEGNKL